MDEKKQFFNGFDDDILDPEDFEDEETDDEEKADVNSEDDEEGDEDEEKSETSEESDDDDEEEEEEDEAVKKAAEAEKNAKFAAARREKERLAKEAKIKEEATLEAELGVITKNPYTEEAIKDKSDLEIYKVMKQIDDEGGDPIADLPQKMAEINRKKEAEAKAEEEKKTANSTKIKAEVKELKASHPDLNLAELGKDQEYLDLCEAKGGRWTMLECYDYLTEKRAATKTTKTTDKVVKDGGKKATKVPSSNSNGGKATSETNYLEMTDEEYIKLQKKEKDDFF